MTAQAVLIANYVLVFMEITNAERARHIVDVICERSNNEPFYEMSAKAATQMAQCKEQLIEQLTAFAVHLNKRGAFRDDLCMDFEHEAQSFIESQNIINERRVTMDASVVKYKFLHCNKQKKVIEQMYGNEFDNFAINREKYLAFLNRVVDDNRVDELNNILETMKGE